MSKTVVEPNSDNLLDAELALETLKAAGITDYEVVVANDTDIQLDYDNCPNLDDNPLWLPLGFDDLVSMFGKAYPMNFKGWKRTRSKSGNLHVTLLLRNPMDIMERIAWQAVFGSDPKREALHLIAAKRNVKNPILLFEPKNRTDEIFGAPEIAAAPAGRLFREDVAEEDIPAGSA